MRFDCLRPGELSTDQLARWRAIQARKPTVSSPYFCPEFSLGVASVRDDAYVTVIEEGGTIRGFFPFQRSRTGFGRPIGGKLSDYHGLVAEEGFLPDPARLLKASGLVSWEFDHLPTDQSTFASSGKSSSSAPVINLEGGWEAYRAGLDGSGSQIASKLEYYLRRLKKDIGPVLITHTSESLDTLDTLIAWKSSQYARSGLIDIFSVPWTSNLLRTFLGMNDGSFRGVLSELRAGDRLIAAHFGIRTERTWHWWFPAYDIDFSKYSPGMLLLFDAIRAACESGIAMIDLGKGEADYKTRLGNGFIPLLEGEIAIPSLRMVARDGFRAVKDGLRKSPLYGLFKRPLQWAGRLERSLRVR